MWDRGQMSLLSCEEGVFVREWSKQNPEARANRYASDLLMPIGMFKPRSAGLKRIDFDAVRSLAKIFKTSLSATAIRLVEHGPLPAILVCSSSSGIEWTVKKNEIKLWVQQPSPYTYAYDILKGTGDEASGEVDASAWFDHPVAGRNQIHEHSIRGFQGLVRCTACRRKRSLRRMITRPLGALIPVGLQVRAPQLFPAPSARHR